MSVKIIREHEGCTKENLEAVLPSLERDMGVKRIIVHRGVDRIMSNTAYIFCNACEGTKISAPETVRFTVKLPFPLTLAQTEYYALPKGSTGALRFVSWEESIVGYWNETQNVLWVSDITHHKGPKGRPL